MPRPTPAQLAYGSSTVVCVTLAMLLVSGATSGPAIALIAVLALALGLLVALHAPLTHAVRHWRAVRSATPATPTAQPTPAGPALAGAESAGSGAATSVQQSVSEDGATTTRRLIPAGHGH